MAGTALTDLNAVSTAVSAADQSLGLATGVNITDQVNAIKVRVQETACLVA
jgi:hypothetical protein